jgi:hypothetical protein
VIQQKGFAEKVHAFIVLGTAVTEVLGERFNGAIVVTFGSSIRAGGGDGKSGEDGTTSLKVVGNNDEAFDAVSGIVFEVTCGGFVELVILITGNNEKSLSQRVLGGSEFSVFKKADAFVVEGRDED